MTIYERMGASCPLCALWPRLERIARLETRDPVTGRPARGLSAFNTFTLGWFFGKFIADEAVLCDEHRNFVQLVCFKQARMGGIVLLESTMERPDAGAQSAEDVDLHEGRAPVPTDPKKRV